MRTALPPDWRTISKICLPRMPPTAAPSAKGVPRLFSTWISPPRLRTMLVKDMAKTVQPERKLMVATGRPEVASITGLMMTPPPTPLMPPAVVAIRQIRKLNRISTALTNGGETGVAFPQQGQAIVDKGFVYAASILADPTQREFFLRISHVLQGD